jgi:AbrB family looped-hinge helix DNA binding protein
MKTSMDRAGRLVIPKEIRREARIEPGAPLDVRWKDGRIEIEPAYAQVRLERRGKLLVAVPTGKMPKLTHEMVERTRTMIHEERATAAGVGLLKRKKP